MEEMESDISHNFHVYRCAETLLDPRRHKTQPVLKIIAHDNRPEKHPTWNVPSTIQWPFASYGC